VKGAEKKTYHLGLFSLHRRKDHVLAVGRQLLGERGCLRAHWRPLGTARAVSDVQCTQLEVAADCLHGDGCWYGKRARIIISPRPKSAPRGVSQETLRRAEMAGEGETVRKSTWKSENVLRTLDPSPSPCTPSTRGDLTAHVWALSGNQGRQAISRTNLFRLFANARGAGSPYRLQLAEICHCRHRHFAVCRARNLTNSANFTEFVDVLGRARR
jgi:hypothetical protein